MAAGHYSRIFIKKTRPLQWLFQEKVIKQKALRFAFYNKIYAFLLNTDSLRSVQKTRIAVKRQRLLQSHYASKVVRRCLNSGRTHNVPQRYLLSRMRFRQYAHLGALPNTVKAVR